MGSRDTNSAWPRLNRDASTMATPRFRDSSTRSRSFSIGSRPQAGTANPMVNTIAARRSATSGHRSSSIVSFLDGGGIATRSFVPSASTSRSQYCGHPSSALQWGQTLLHSSVVSRAPTRLAPPIYDGKAALQLGCCNIAPWAHEQQMPVPCRFVAAMPVSGWNAIPATVAGNACQFPHTGLPQQQQPWIGYMESPQLVHGQHTGPAEEYVPTLPPQPPQQTYITLPGTTQQLQCCLFQALASCALCNEAFHATSVVCQLPACRCRHIYHASCIENWLHRKSRCPTCKTPVDEDMVYQDDRATSTRFDPDDEWAPPVNHEHRHRSSWLTRAVSAVQICRD